MFGAAKGRFLQNLIKWMAFDWLFCCPLGEDAEIGHPLSLIKILHCE